MVPTVQLFFASRAHNMRFQVGLEHLRYFVGGKNNPQSLAECLLAFVS